MYTHLGEGRHVCVPSILWYLVMQPSLMLSVYLPPAVNIKVLLHDYKVGITTPG